MMQECAVQMTESSDGQDRAMKSSRHARRGTMRTFCEQVIDAFQAHEKKCADHFTFLQSQVAYTVQLLHMQGAYILQ